MDFNQFNDDIYDDKFDATYRFLKSGLSGNLDHDIFTLNQTLDTLWIYYGNNQSGRGDIAQMKIEAEIAATELMLFELREKKAAILKEVS